MNTDHKNKGTKLAPMLKMSNKLHTDILENSSAQKMQSGNLKLNPQPKIVNKRKQQTLPGGKLLPLFRNQASSSKLESKKSSDHFQVLPHISAEFRNGSDSNVQKELDNQNLIPTAVRIYLCSNYEDMKAERTVLMKKAFPQIQQYCSQFNLSFQLVDINWTTNPVFRSRTQRLNEITLCQDSSLGPNFVLLLGDKIGNELGITEIAEAEYKVLLEMGSTNLLSNRDLLGSFIKDGSQHPPVYVLKSSITFSEYQNLVTLLQTAATLAKDAGMMSEDALKKYFHSVLEEDVGQGIFRAKEPRNSCLCYCRELQHIKLSATDAQDFIDVVQNEKGENIVNLTRQQLCQSLTGEVKKYLGTINCKQFSVKLLNSETISDSTNFDAYLEKLCADFVSDVKDLVKRRIDKLLSNQSMAKFAHNQEVNFHQLTLFGKKTECFHGQEQLLLSVKAFLCDPKRNSRPFVIHGRSGFGKSSSIAAVARALKIWFKTNYVMVVRFLGKSTEFCNIHRAVASITEQICHAYSIPIPDVGKFSTLFNVVTSFRATLEVVSKEHASSRPLFILLDGIDCLQPYTESLEALWAIKNLPPNVHLVLSSMSVDGENNILGALLALLTDLIAEVPSISEADANKVIGEYSTRLGRKLTEDQVDSIKLAFSTTHSPAHLHSLLKMAYDSKPDSGISIFPNSPGNVLLSTLDMLEKQFGMHLIKYFASYLTISNKGILDEEMCSLLALNKEVIDNLHYMDFLPRDGAVYVPFALVSNVKQSLIGFIEDRLICGKIGFGWSNTEFFKTAAQRYRVLTIGMPEDFIQEDTASFTVNLHEQFVDIYLNPEHRSQIINSTTEGDEPLDLELSSAAQKWDRLLTHMKVLVPVEGLSRIKKGFLFNLDWLVTWLNLVPHHILLKEILAFHSLCEHLSEQSMVDDEIDDIKILFEFFQKFATDAARDQNALAVEIVGSLGLLAKPHVYIAELVKQARDWIDNTDKMLVVPVHTIWPYPGSLVKYQMGGPTHFVGCLRNSEVGVFFSRNNGVQVWRLETGEQMFHFPAHPEQDRSGILCGRYAEFAIIAHYSNLNKSMDLKVWSTETGIELLAATFPREFEAMALNDDDQVLAVAMMSQVDGAAQPVRCIMGIAVQSRDIVFQIPAADVHKTGIGKLIFVRNIKREMDSLVSFGTVGNQDLGFWDLESRELDFSLDLGFWPNLTCINTECKVVICASSHLGRIAVVNLARGAIEQTLENVSYRGMTDLTTLGDNIFIATPTSGIHITSISSNSIVGIIPGKKGSSSAATPPSKLLAIDRTGDVILFVGYSSGKISIFDISIPDSEVGVLEGHNSCITSLNILKIDQLLSTGTDGVAIIWNYEETIQLSTLNGSMRNRHLKHEREDPSLQLTLDVNQNVVCYAISPDEKRICTASSNGSIRVWDIETGLFLRSIVESIGVGIEEIYFAYKGRLLIGHCAAERLNVRILQVWNAEKDEHVQFEGGNPVVYCSLLMPSGDRVMTIGPGSSLQLSGLVLEIYDLFDMKCVTKLHCNISGIMDSRNLRMLGFYTESVPNLSSVAASDASSLKSIEIGDQEMRPDEGRSTSYHLVLDYFPQANVSFFFLFTISGKNMEDITMDCHQPMHINTVKPECSSILPDGNCLTGSVDGLLVLWNTRTRDVGGKFCDPSLNSSSQKDTRNGVKGGSGRKTAHQGPIMSVAVSVEKQLVVSGGKDGRIKVWNLSNRQLVASVAGCQGEVHSLTLSADVLLSASRRDVLCLWKIGKTLDRVARFYCHEYVTDLHLLGDKNRIVAKLHNRNPKLLLLKMVNF